MSSYGASARSEKAAALEPVIDRTQQEIAALEQEINEAYRHYHFHREHLGMRGQELQDYVHKLEDTLRSKRSEYIAMPGPLRLHSSAMW
jgi:flagellar biosynthesis chaperone FliJ